MILKNYKDIGLRDGAGLVIPGWKSLEDIRDEVYKRTNEWPRVLSGRMFVESDDGVRLLATEQDLSAWLKTKMGIDFSKKRLMRVEHEETSLVDPVSMVDLVRYMVWESKHKYENYEKLPHHPRLPLTYYACGDKYDREGDGLALDTLCEMLNYEDRLVDLPLMKAAIVTQFAGVPNGQRPAYVYTTKHGRGAGKTTTAQTIVDVAGGCLGIGAREPVDRIMSSFFTEASLSKRSVLVDNVKGELRTATFESLITCDKIEGHWLHRGRASRNNTMTWMFTANSPKLSSDLAQRSVIIHIGRPKSHNDVDFREKIKTFMEKNHEALIRDCLTFLKGPDRGVVSPRHRTRFQSWNKAVLQKFDNADYLARVIQDRMMGVDADREIGFELHARLETRLEECGRDVKTERCFIPWSVVAEEVTDIEGEQTSSKAAAKVMREMLGNRPFHLCSENTSTSLGRGMVWMGESHEEGGIQKWTGPKRRVKPNRGS